MSYSKRFQNDSRWKRKAKDCISDEKKMSRLLQRCKSLLNKDVFSKAKDSLKSFYEYIKDSTSGRYKNYSVAKLTLVIAAVIYVVSPLDFLPDYIPFIGFTDDVSIVVWTAKTMKEEINAYRSWKNNSGTGYCKFQIPLQFKERLFCDNLIFFYQSTGMSLFTFFEPTKAKNKMYARPATITQ